MNWEALIASSRVLVTPIPPASQPTEEALRRAISTAYCAMFHGPQLGFDLAQRYEVTVLQIPNTLPQARHNFCIAHDLDGGTMDETVPKTSH